MGDVGLSGASRWSYRRGWLTACALCVIDAALAFAQGIIDGRPFAWLLDPDLAPHREAARIIAVPRGLIALAVLVIVGFLAGVWFVRMARNA